MKIKVELSNKITGGIAIASVEIKSDVVELEKLLRSIPPDYEYCTYWVVEPPAPEVKRLRY